MRPSPLHGLLRRIALSAAAIASSVLALGRCAEPQPTPVSAPSEAPRLSPALAESKAIEDAIIAVAASVRPATVCLVFDDEGTNRRGTGSGVIVADDGERAIVLTCGHVTRTPGRACSIVLPDGRLFFGESTASLQRDGFDLGLVAFETGGDRLPVAEIATEQPEIGEWIVVLGHPRGLWIDDEPEAESGAEASAVGSAVGDTVGETVGESEGEMVGATVGPPASVLGPLVAPRWRTDSGAPRRERDRASLSGAVRPPVVRAGRLWAEPGIGTGLRFDAPIEAGDSGGPVVDLSGRVVGVASRCGWKSFWNWASSTEILAGDALQLLDEALDVPPGDADPGAGAAHARIPKQSRDSAERLLLLRPAATRAGASVISIESDGGPRAFAIAVRADGYLMTKASEVGFSAPLIASRDGRRVRAERVAYDPDADLLLLRADAHDFARPMPLAAAEPAAGSLLLNVGADGELLSTGFMSLESSRLEDPDARPFLGISWRAEREGTASVRSVVPGTPAARADVRDGDRIVTADGRPFTSQRSLSEMIAAKRVGDELALEVDRGGERRALIVRLDRRQPSIRVRDRGNTRVSVSRVLPYRTLVWQQDGVVDPEQCGSAVVDLDGRFVGMNIGRVDRTATLVLPAEELDRRTAALLARAADDPQRFDALASASFAVTESAGRVRLSTLDARFVGPRRLARLIGNALTPDGTGITIMADDRLLWDAIVDAPGRFELVFAGAVRESRTLRLGIGELEIEAEVPAGRHRRGIVLGEVDIDATGRIPISLEWADDAGAEVPGNISYLELRRLREQQPISLRDRSS